MQKLFLHAVSIPTQRLYGRVIIFCGTPRTYTWKLLRSKNCFSDQKQYKPLTRRSNTAIIREESACNNPTFMNVLKIYTCAYSKRYSAGYCRTVSCLFPCFWQNRMQRCNTDKWPPNFQSIHWSKKTLSKALYIIESVVMIRGVIVSNNSRRSLHLIANFAVLHTGLVIWVFDIT